LPPCDAQAIAKAARGYVCAVQTNGGAVSWRVEVVVASESRTFRPFQDQKIAKARRRQIRVLFLRV